MDNNLLTSVIKPLNYNSSVPVMLTFNLYSGMLQPSRWMPFDSISRSECKDLEHYHRELLAGIIDSILQFKCLNIVFSHIFY